MPGSHEDRLASEVGLTQKSSARPVRYLTFVDPQTQYEQGTRVGENLKD